MQKKTWAKKVFCNQRKKDLNLWVDTKGFSAISKAINHLVQLNLIRFWTSFSIYLKIDFLVLKWYWNSFNRFFNFYLLNLTNLTKLSKVNMMISPWYK